MASQVNSSKCVQKTANRHMTSLEEYADALEFGTGIFHNPVLGCANYMSITFKLLG